MENEQDRILEAGLNLKTIEYNNVKEFYACYNAHFSKILKTKHIL